MASELNYATVEDLENLLLVDVDTTFEGQIDTWISAAETRVNNYLGYTTMSGLWNESIVDEIQDARVDGDSNLVVHTRKRPINSVSALSLVKGSNSIDLTLTSGDDTKYIIPVQENVLVYPNYEFASDNSTVSVGNFYQVKNSRWYTKMSYVAGYTSIPADISQATALMAADTFMRHANKEGLVSITQGRISKRWRERSDGKSDLILDAENILNHYKIASGWF